jgi:RNA polymerase sigma-70 factor (ECF subfamily)
VDSDRALVDAAAAGDREAYDELVRRYQVQILSLARALLGGSADAEDIAQEVFVRAWRSIRGFRGEGTFRAWLHRVAVNLLHSHQRYLTRERRFFRTRDAKDDDASEAERMPSPFDLEHAVTLRLAIDRALAQLPMEYRSAVVLRDIQGLDYKEIAETLGVPIGTVESRIFRGRHRLRMLLDPLRGRPDSGDRPPRGALSWAQDDRF